MCTSFCTRGRWGQSISLGARLLSGIDAAKLAAGPLPYQTLSGLAGPIDFGASVDGLLHQGGTKVVWTDSGQHLKQQPPTASGFISQEITSGQKVRIYDKTGGVERWQVDSLGVLREGNIPLKRMQLWDGYSEWAAGEAISAHSLVTLYQDVSVYIRNADLSTVLRRMPAIGITLTGALSGEKVKVYRGAVASARVETAAEYPWKPNLPLHVGTLGQASLKKAPWISGDLLQFIGWTLQSGGDAGALSLISVGSHFNQQGGNSLPA